MNPVKSRRTGLRFDTGIGFLCQVGIEVIQGNIAPATGGRYRDRRQFLSILLLGTTHIITRFHQPAYVRRKYINGLSETPEGTVTHSHHPKAHDRLGRITQDFGACFLRWDVPRKVQTMIVSHLLPP